MMLRRLWRSTFGIVAVVALVFAAATLAIGAVAYAVTHEALEKQLDHRVAVESQALLDEAKEGGLASIAAAIRLREQARTGASLDYLLLDRNGRAIAATIAPLGSVKPGYDELFGFRRERHTGIGQSLTTALPDGVLVVVADRRDLDGIDRTLEYLLTGALGVMLALGVGAAVLVAWLTRRRLARVQTTATAIIAGDLSQRVPRDGSDSEFDRLAATINAMLDRIAALMDNLRQVSSDVAHDLRTPLTRLCNQLERASISDVPADRATAIRAARDQADDLLDIFSALLRIAEVEGFVEQKMFAEINLSELLTEMAETYGPVFDGSGRSLTAEIPAGIWARVDRRLLAQGVSNLLENALRHTPRGTRATLSLKASKAGAIDITVIDDGPGVTGQNIDRLFERFVRADASRNGPGHGLGLSLVRAIAIRHGGEAALVPLYQGFGVRLRIAAAIQI